MRLTRLFTNILPVVTAVSCSEKEDAIYIDQFFAFGTLGPFTVDPNILPMLKEANRLSRLSSGLFNPVIGKHSRFDAINF